MNRRRCIKQYIKSVSVAHENVSETSVYLTNIAFISLHMVRASTASRKCLT